MKFKRSPATMFTRLIAIVGLGSLLALVGLLHSAAAASGAWLPSALQPDAGIFSAQLFDASLLPAGYL